MALLETVLVLAVPAALLSTALVGLGIGPWVARGLSEVSTDRREQTRLE